MTNTPHAESGVLARPALISDPDVLLSVRNLRTTFATESGLVKAVDGISFDIRRGEVLGIVGESGSGKSVTSLSIMGLLEVPPAKITADEMKWKGEDLLHATQARMRQIRGGEIAVIFQDPLTALNPVQTVGRQVAEMARIHEKASKKDAWEKAIEMLRLVGIPQPDRRAKMHPHEFSGGMRQRAMIAMAITCNPDLLIADEPTTALDVTVQAQVLDVLMEIKDEIDSSIMLITHDLGVVAGLADRVMVMYAGREAEVGTAHEVFYETRHPYTLGLLASLPRLDDIGDEQLRPIRGAPPSLVNPPSGCAFHPRCDFARDERCPTEVPLLRVIDGPGLGGAKESTGLGGAKESTGLGGAQESTAHYSACHYAEELRTVEVSEFREEAAESVV